MIFLKHFDTSRQTLLGVGKVYVQRNSKVGDLFSYINEKMRWPAGTPLKLYEVWRELNEVMVAINWLLIGYYGPVGNQTWDDRADEAKDDFCTERNSGW